MKPKGLSKPTRAERGTKVAVYGSYGTGKTNFIMSATEVGHLLLLDTEGRSQYYGPEEGHGFEVIYSNDIADALDLLAYAEELHAEGGDNVIFAIDSFSSIWYARQEVAEALGTTRRGTAKFSSWGPAKKPLKQLYARLFATPVDCIITMRSKPTYDIDGKGEPKELAWQTPDTERGLNYAVDLVMEMRKEAKPPGTLLQPEDFWAVVVKTSGPSQDNPTPVGLKVIDPSFAKVRGLRVEGTGRLIFHEDKQATASTSRKPAASVDPKEMWEAFLKKYNITEGEALAALGTGKVSEWLKLNQGKSLPDAMQEIRAVMGL